MQYTTNIILIPYELKYQFSLCKHIQFTANLKQVFNYHSGNEITTSNNFKKGFWYKRKFYKLNDIQDKIELIPKYNINLNDPLINL